MGWWRALIAQATLFTPKTVDVFSEAFQWTASVLFVTLPFHVNVKPNTFCVILQLFLCSVLSFIQVLAINALYKSYLMVIEGAWLRQRFDS